jgi:DNA-binding winged helix-turn-helix (wHTH) protein
LVGLDPTLVIKSGVPIPTTVSLVRWTSVVGKHPNSDVVLANPYVSRSHARIEISGVNATIQDLSSKNGTFVDGVRVRNQPLKLTDGSVIEFGRDQVRAEFYMTEGTLTLENVGIGRIDSANSNFSIDKASRQVWLNEQLISPALAKKAFDILLLLSSRMGKICTHAEISRAGWPERERGEVDDAEIRQYIRRIRLGFNTITDAKVQIVTLRGSGYRLDVE